MSALGKQHAIRSRVIFGLVYVRRDDIVEWFEGELADLRAGVQTEGTEAVTAAVQTLIAHMRKVGQ